MTGQLGLPWQGTTALSAHTSAMGAVAASERAGRQALALLALYRDRGPLTDREAAEALGVERTTVNARRAELRKLRLVRAVGVRRAATGINNTTWGLVEGGGRG